MNVQCIYMYLRVYASAQVACACPVVPHTQVFQRNYNTSTCTCTFCRAECCPVSAHSVYTCIYLHSTCTRMYIDMYMLMYVPTRLNS